MTWTYSGDPASSNRDEVRFLVGDTDTTDQLVTDEEIAYAITQEANNTLAAALVCKAIASKFARKADREIGDLKIKYSQQNVAYLKMAAKLSEEGRLSAATPFAGGLSIAGKDAREDDTDRVKPGFTRGMHDNYGSDPTTQDICD